MIDSILKNQNVLSQKSLMFNYNLIIWFKWRASGVDRHLTRVSYHLTQIYIWGTTYIPIITDV